MKPRSHGPLLQPGASDVLQHYGPRSGLAVRYRSNSPTYATHRDHDFKVFGIAWQYRWGGGY